jgi:hypothetical protein
LSQLEKKNTITKEKNVLCHDKERVVAMKRDQEGGVGGVRVVHERKMRKKHGK